MTWINLLARNHLSETHEGLKGRPLSEKSPRIRTGVTLSGWKGQLDQINCQLNYRDTRRVVGVEYQRPLTDSTESVRFSRMKLMNDDDVWTMFSIFGQYSTIGPKDLDALLVRSVEQIHKSLIQPKSYGEIRVLLDAPHEDISLADSWWRALFYLITGFMLSNYD